MMIDPHAWLLTVPLTLALVQVFRSPANGACKRWWRELQTREAWAWDRLGWARPRCTPASLRAMQALAIAGLGVSSLASFAAFAGLLPVN